MAHVARSPLGIGLIFNADLSELLSALSSPWGLTLSSGCRVYGTKVTVTVSVLSAASASKKRERGGRHFCWLALQSEESLSLNSGQSLLSELN